MKKRDLIWREILEGALRGQLQFTQEDLAIKLKTSTAVVFNALKQPREVGIIEVRGRFFRLIDFNKFLDLWKVHRHLMRDTVYQAHSDLSVEEIEKRLPKEVVLTGFSAYRQRFKEVPADYDVVTVYKTNQRQLATIKKEFPDSKINLKFPRLIVYDGRELNFSKEENIPLTQLYVDLWNFPKWYAKDYLEALKLKLDDLLSRRTNQ